MKYVKTIILGTLIVGTAALGASAYANRGGDRFQDRMIERISKRLELTDTQVMALNGLADELKETRVLMKGGSEDMRADMTSLVNSSTFDQGKTLSMINDRVGIAPTQLLYVTDALYRPDPSRSRDTGGFGMGLTLAKHT